MYKGIFYTHLITVNLFLLIYLVKNILLLANKEEALAKLTKVLKVPEMIISTLFLLTGIYMLTQVPEINYMMIIKIVLVFASIPLAVIGFKKKKKALALLSFVMIIAAYGLAEMSKKKGASPAPETAAGASTGGHDIYTANCVSCHGEDGKLGLMDAGDLSVSALSLDERISIIKNGKDAMAGFNGRLTDEQIRAVAEYTETLGK
jgi:mono/diheme cytochrome c family protein